MFGFNTEGASGSLTQEVARRTMARSGSMQEGPSFTNWFQRIGLANFCFTNQPNYQAIKREVPNSTQWSITSGVLPVEYFHIPDVQPPKIRVAKNVGHSLIHHLEKVDSGLWKPPNVDQFCLKMIFVLKKTPLSYGTINIYK